MKQRPVLAKILLCTLCAVILHCLSAGVLASPRISTDKRVYLPGETMQVHFSGAPGASGDWVCIVATSAPDTYAGTYEYIPYGLPQGVLSFVAPYPGEYEARAYFNYRAIGYVVSARSPFKVVSQLPTASSRSSSRNSAEERQALPLPPDPRLKEAQYVLMERGYDPGSPDGVSGRQTRTALQRFQKDNGLKQTGELNRNTLMALGLIPGWVKKDVSTGALPIQQTIPPQPEQHIEPPATAPAPGNTTVAPATPPAEAMRLPEPPVEPKQPAPAQ